MSDRRATDPRIPALSLVFGYGPMLPLLAAAIAVWVGGLGLKLVAVRMAIIWGALILSFIGGVRRGFGFGQDRASTGAELGAAMSYVALAGLALVVPRADWAAILLAVGYALAALLDHRAAVAGDAPRFFARLRPTQLLLATLSFAAIWSWFATVR